MQKSMNQKMEKQGYNDEYTKRSISNRFLMTYWIKTKRGIYNFAFN